jgi:hypothetical protein
MEATWPVWTTLAGCLATLGGSVLIFKATWRSEVYWWTDPIFWIGVAGLTTGALVFLLLLAPPHLRNRQARRAVKEERERQVRANMRDGLTEILTELGQVSSQLKAERAGGSAAPVTKHRLGKE